MHRVAVLVALFAAAYAQEWPSTVPFWPTYDSRRVQTLNGTWDFGYGEETCDPTSVTYEDIQTPNTTTVPLSFDVAPPGVLGPRLSCIFYRSSHACTPGTASLVKFYAVNHYARVFMDGVPLLEHTAGGYTPFQVVSGVCGASGTRELAVVVANTQNSTLSPTFTGGDFYFYSGIIRPVVVTELPTATAYWIDRVEPVSTDYVKGLIEVRVVLGGSPSALPPSVRIRLGFNGAPLGPASTVPVNGSVATLANVPVPDFKLWTLRQGNLFTLTVEEEASGDTMTIRSGLRVLGIDAGTARITINGEIVKMLGFNRHTLWLDTGAAVTPEQEATDLAILQGLNATYVRGAHYPQSQSWLDRLDEAGMVIWEETLGPGVSLKNIQDPVFMAAHLAAVASMVETSFAHPSVVFHGFFNEGPSNDAAACPGYAASAQAITSRVGTPPMRLVTWASDKDTTDHCYASADVISMNHYPGWYDHCCDPSFCPVFWGRMVNWTETTWPTKPLMVSETGGGAIYEWKNDTAPAPGPQWSQQYQKNLVEADASFLAGNPRVSGLTLWQFSDIKANDADTQSCGSCEYLPHPPSLSVPWDCAYISTACGRPGGENHKGVVDAWRRPKEEAPVVAAIYGNVTGGVH